MPKRSRQPRKPKAARGPKAALLKITGNWKKAIKQSFAKKKPPEGWPK